MPSYKMMQIVPGCYVSATVNGEKVVARVITIHKRSDGDCLLCEHNSEIIKLKKEECSLEYYVVGDKKYTRTGELVNEK